MGSVVLHAGMPKAGSSSIQAWLSDRSSWLRERRIDLLVATDHDHDRVRIVPHRSGGVVSWQFVVGYRAFGRDPATLHRLFGEIDEATTADRTTILTAEGFADFFSTPDSRFIDALEQLARSHEVRVAYYVRPQHTSMEAAWRQWGYRLDDPPSAYLAQWADTLEYLGTLDAVRAAAPSVTFEVRPFRADLLPRGDVVTDFATHFLGLDEVAAPPDERWENRGFPLDVVNVLRTAPPGLLGDSEHDNRLLNQLRPLVHQLDLAPSAEAEQSRRIIQAYCHERFEAANRELIARLGWDTTHLVPEPDESTAAPGDLTLIDELWSTPSAEATRVLMFSLLRRVRALTAR